MLNQTNLSNDELIQENASLLAEIKELKKKLAMSNSSFLSLVGKSLEGIVIIDTNKMVIYTNFAAIELFDRSIADLLGEPLNLDFNTDKLLYGDESVTELLIPKANGSNSIAEVSAFTTEWNNEPCFIIVFRDITARKKSEELLEYMSNHDYLTDLPNRIFFEKQMKYAIEKSNLTNSHMALLYLDLDNFKMVNDSLGHDIGDLLLKQVSNILQNTTRIGDFVARLGGDEFAIILTALKKPDYAAKVAQDILDKLRQIFNLDGSKVYANASIGIAVYPNSGKDAVSLVKNADCAMYNAKSRGKNQYSFYSQELSEQNNINLLITNGLRNVPQNQQLFLEYQPIIDLGIERCCGIEALLRWDHPQLGLVPPSKFLPFAQDAGIMPKIGSFVLNQAIADFKHLDIGNSWFISINVCADELDGAKTITTILDLLKTNQIEPHRFILELTETSLMQRPDETIKKLKRLDEEGGLVAVDDFGIGYSSLSYLKRLPVFILKIDKFFADGIGKNIHDEIIIESIIHLGHSLGFRIVAEGIETQEQVDFLKRLHCDYIQGYFYSKPLPFDKLKAYAKEQIGT